MTSDVYQARTKGDPEMAVLIKVALPNEATPPDIGGTERKVVVVRVNGTPLREWEKNSAMTLTTKDAQ